jgi:hypothetical protein
MDEYQVEMGELRSRIAKLKLARASVVIIEELEAQLRILRALYNAATQVYAEGEADPAFQVRFQQRELGDWTFENVYSYVYEIAVELDPAGGDLASRISKHDYLATLLQSTKLDARAG